MYEISYVQEEFKYWLSLALILIMCPNGVVSWPEGKYGLPMSKSGCPVSGNVNWLQGTRVQITEEGSYGSEGNHLEGIKDTKGSTIETNYCMKLVNVADGDDGWMPGQYCIYKKEVCPNGFQEGAVYWDDAGPVFFGSSEQSHSGSLPDGTYNQNTKIYYCCRVDGPSGRPIRITRISLTPFYLLQYGSECQQVEGHDVSEEFIYWAGESSLNMDGYTGTIPKITRYKLSSPFTKMNYCYYEPVEEFVRGAAATSAVLGVIGVVAFLIILSVLGCALHRILGAYWKKRSRHSRDSRAVQRSSVDNGMTELSPSGLEPSGPLLRSESDGRHCDRSLQIEDGRDSATNFSPFNRGDLRDASRPDSLPPSYEEVLRAEGRL